MLVDNNKEFKIKDLISYSMSLYRDQGFELTNNSLQKELSDFLIERLRYYMKEKEIRIDIVDASINSHLKINIVMNYKPDCQKAKKKKNKI